MILIAPTAYKGTIGAVEAARALAAGARRALPDVPVRELPLSDGGPGLIAALRAARGGDLRWHRVHGPLGEPVRARSLRLGSALVVETADACGLHLVATPHRDPLRATTFGVGELIRAAVRADAGRRGAGNARAGARRLVLGLGGSATVDGGAGMAEALGWRLLDEAGRPLPRGGGALQALARILPPASEPGLPPVTALCDVRNPLLGAGGAAAVFGPQKGADARGVARLERGLARLAETLRADLGREVATLEGAGAAGGLGAGVAAFLRGELVAGSDWVLQAVGFEAALAGARLVVTGEGAYDEQSAMGKIVGAVVARARLAGVPVLIVAGSITTPLPAGVSAVDAEGGQLLPATLEAVAAREVTRLLRA